MSSPERSWLSADPITLCSMKCVYIVALLMALAGHIAQSSEVPTSAAAHPPQECIYSTSTLNAFPPEAWVAFPLPQFNLMTQAPLQFHPAGSRHRRKRLCRSCWAAGETAAAEWAAFIMFTAIASLRHDNLNMLLSATYRCLL